jgi:predicted Fe-Mo cluster-binding NifX family protein
MRVGIAAHAGRISPVLDVARRVVIVDVEGSREVGRREAELEAGTLSGVVAQLGELEVDVLVCGAVSWPLEAALSSMGLRVVARVCGPVEEVLRALVAGELDGGAYRMPGCGGGGRRRRGGQRRRLAGGGWRGA